MAVASGKEGKCLPPPPTLNFESSYGPDFQVNGHVCGPANQLDNRGVDQPVLDYITPTK